VIASKTAVGALLPVGFADRRQLVAPLSGLSIALVVSVQSSSADAGLSWVVTTVIGGAIATELLIRDRGGDGAASPAEPGAPTGAQPGAPTGAPIDELDDAGSGAVDGPIYRDDSAPHRPGGAPRSRSCCCSRSAA